MVGCKEYDAEYVLDTVLSGAVGNDHWKINCQIMISARNRSNKNNALCEWSLENCYSELSTLDMTFSDKTKKSALVNSASANAVDVSKARGYGCDKVGHFHRDCTDPNRKPFPKRSKRKG